jgi:16S rRNA (cytosine1402-N4)-methyltransferase
VTPRPSSTAAARLEGFGERVTLVHAVYDEIADVLADQGLAHVDGVLFDLGVSSMQLDVRDRGFSYAEDAPLDMRMDETEGITAAEVLNTYSAADLARILREYGEERFAKRIADRIVRARQTTPFTRRRTWSTWSATRSPPPPGAPAATRPSARSRRCASRSTTSSAC